jgi:signal transduction histidine kinase
VGRDAPQLKATLNQAKISFQVVADSQALRLALQGETGALLLTEEALRSPVPQVLQGFLATQAAWSNLPLVLLVDEHNLVALRRTLLNLLGAESQLTLLVRPVAPTTLVAVLQAALWARRRQYEVRGLLTQLARQNETLEQRVAERTAELERRNHELDQFTYIASHDLKEPLRGIKQLATWILQDNAALLPEPAQKHLALLHERTARLDTLVDDLLAYARAGRERYPPERVEVAHLVRDIVEQLGPPAGFLVTINEPTPALLAERVPLAVVFRNLIGNAIKHHHQPGAGKVQVSAQAQGRLVVFTVADNGPGIAAQFHERIFHLFPTLKPASVREGGGVGLPLIKRIVESHGGTIQVESSLDQGTTIRFTWPRVPPPSDIC